MVRVAAPRAFRRDTLGGMPELFDYKPHPHTEKRKETGAPKVAAAAATLHGPGPIGRFNAKVGLKITLVVGTMWAAYVFTVITLISAPTAFKSGAPLIIVGWIAQTFLQLVLLSIIIVGQKVSAEASDERALNTYNDAEAVLHEAIQIQEHLAAQDALLARLLESPSPDRS